MISDEIKIEIGLKKQTISGREKLDFFLENIAGNTLNLSCVTRLEFSGVVDGWSTFDFLYHFARHPFQEPIEFSLTSGQNIFSKLPLSRLFYSLNAQGSVSPSLTWMQFISFSSNVNSDIKIQAICDFELPDGNSESVESNVINVRLVKKDDEHTDILEALENVNLLIQDLSMRVSNLEKPKNP